MDDQIVLTEVFGELKSGCKFEFKINTGIFPDPAGKLYRSDVFALAVMSASFAYQDLCAVLKFIQHIRAFDRLVKDAFKSRHEDRE